LWQYKIESLNQQLKGNIDQKLKGAKASFSGSPYACWLWLQEIKYSNQWSNQRRRKAAFLVIKW